MPKLTDAVVRNAKARVKRYEISEESGLSLRVSTKGAKSWVWRYRIDGHQKRLTIGNYPAMPVSKARSVVSNAQNKLACGHDPVDDRPTAETVASFAIIYRERHLSKLKSGDEQWRRIQVDILRYLGKLKLADVTRRRLNDLVHNKVSNAPVSANRLRSLVVHLFQCAVDWGFLELSPASGLPRPASERSREIVLSERQLRAVLPAFEEHKDVRIGAILKLMLLTGQRVSEICGMHVRELDLEARLWQLPESRTKNGRLHIVPLGDSAISIIEFVSAKYPDGYLFPAASKRQPFVHQHSIGQAWRRLAARLDLSGATPHDLRRTAATGMGQLGIQPHVIEAVLNHVSGHRAGVAGIYQRQDYLSEKREALELWDRYLQGLLHIHSANEHD